MNEKKFSVFDGHIDRSNETEDAYKQLNIFLRHIGFPISDSHTSLDPQLPEDAVARIEFLQQLQPDHFFTLISHINKIIRRLTPEERQTEYVPNIYVEDTFFREDNPAEGEELAIWRQKDKLSAQYIPPHRGMALLAELVTHVQKETQVQNLERQTTKLRVGIYLAHLFKDGNTRTARITSDIILNGHIEETALADRGYPLLSTAVLKVALFNVLSKEILLCQQPDLPKISNLDDLETKLRPSPKHVLDTRTGLAMPLQFIAVLKSNPNITYKDIRDNCIGIGKLKITENTESANILGSLEATGEIDTYYNLQDKVFWKAQDVLDELTSTDLGSLEIEINEILSTIKPAPSSGR